VPNRLGPDYWLTRAKEARDEAERFTDAKARRMMLNIACNYEELAKAAARIAEAGGSDPAKP
jgi:hypothetical protein